MRIYRDLRAFRPGRGQTAVAIGNFDGLHLGHARILSVLSGLSRRTGWRPVVLTFDPHPEKVLGRRRIQMIQTLDQRLARLEEFGVRTVLVTPFDRGLSRLSPSDFARRVLRDTLQAGAVVVGRDFRFGRDRAGNVASLEAAGRDLGFRLFAVEPVRRGGRIVSSSRIRALLERGRVEEAGLLLGRPYSVSGRVVRGRGVGRTLGFPTANVESENEILPRGVFVTLARFGRADHPSVANIGFRPTFGPGGLSLEALILDRRAALYGRRLEVGFLKKLRPERKFRSPDALAARISLDIRAARSYFARHRQPPRGPSNPGLP
jgi:riboflavin kinase/FMN adenylyltransferase